MTNAGEWSVGGTSRADPVTGVRETVAFLPRPATGDRLFVCVHEPPAAPVGAVLICPSILADLLASYQREAHLARHLARAGLVAVRFHYSGTGNSDGDPAALTPDTLAADARWLNDRLDTRFGSLPRAFVGTRWGALAAVAAATAAGRPAAPIVLCEPIVDAVRFFREAVRSRAMSAVVSRNHGRSAPPARLADILEADGYADILGNVIHRRLYESTLGRDLIGELPTEARPAHVIQFGGRGLRSDLRGVEQRLAAASWVVDTTIVDLVESWWFRAGPRITFHPQLNALTAQWLLDQLDRETVSP